MGYCNAPKLVEVMIEQLTISPSDTLRQSSCQTGHCCLAMGRFNPVAKQSLNVQISSQTCVTACLSTYLTNPFNAVSQRKALRNAYFRN